MYSISYTRTYPLFSTFIRYGVPMMYLNLGQDDEAYDFIKFWLWETKKTCDKNMSCQGNSINHMSCPGEVYKLGVSPSLVSRYCEGYS